MGECRVYPYLGVFATPIARAFFSVRVEVRLLVPACNSRAQWTVLPPRKSRAAYPLQIRARLEIRRLFGESSCLARICPCAKPRRVPPIFIPIFARVRAPQQARNSSPFGESSCLARICPFAKPRRVPPIFMPIAARVRAPQQARNSPPFGESSCLPRICCFAKSRRVFQPFSSPGVSLRFISRLSRKTRAAASPKTRATLPRKPRLFSYPSLPACGHPNGLEIRPSMTNLRAWLEFAPSRNPDAFSSHFHPAG